MKPFVPFAIKRALTIILLPPALLLWVAVFAMLCVVHIVRGLFKESEHRKNFRAWNRRRAGA